MSDSTDEKRGGKNTREGAQRDSFKYMSASMYDRRGGKKTQEREH